MSDEQKKAESEHLSSASDASDQTLDGGTANMRPPDETLDSLPFTNETAKQGTAQPQSEEKAPDASDTAEEVGDTLDGPPTLGLETEPGGVVGRDLRFSALR